MDDNEYEEVIKIFRKEFNISEHEYIGPWSYPDPETELKFNAFIIGYEAAMKKIKKALGIEYDI